MNFFLWIKVPIRPPCWYIYHSGTLMHTKFFNFQNIIFPIIWLLKIFGLQNSFRHSLQHLNISGFALKPKKTNRALYVDENDGVAVIFSKSNSPGVPNFCP